MTSKDKNSRAIARILKVNHAGEYGAIRIYRAQVMMMRLFHKDLVPEFSTMLAHEIEHCRKFRTAMPSRNARPCRAMWFWGLGGTVLGLVTGSMGRNAIFACTEAVEETVHKHLNEQISFLKDKDMELAALISDIRTEEIEHLVYAQKKLTRSRVTVMLQSAIGIATETVIWLSTQGDSSRMRHDIRQKA